MPTLVRAASREYRPSPSARGATLERDDVLREWGRGPYRGQRVELRHDLALIARDDFDCQMDTSLELAGQRVDAEDNQD
jgi:hypothetical protein